VIVEVVFHILLPLCFIEVSLFLLVNIFEMCAVYLYCVSEYVSIFSSTLEIVF